MIRLRKLEEKDAEYMLEWMHDPEIQKWFHLDTAHKDKKAVLDFINSSDTELIDGHSIHYAIVDDNDEYLGTISLKGIDLLSRHAEYAISLRKKAQGHGIATEATKILLHRSFYEFDMERIYLNVLSENKRAIHLYEKCGFIYEGEFRKHIFHNGEFKTLKWYSILKEDYIL